jgi:hypothetical protein
MDNYGLIEFKNGGLKMINKSLSHPRAWHMSPATTAVLLSLSVYLLWTIATYLLEGRINLLQQPTIGGRYVYVLVANVLIGTVGALWVLRWLLTSQVVTLAQVGFRSLRRTLVVAAIGAVLGFGLLLQSQPISLAPLVLWNGFAQVLPVSIAEVVVCWVLVGASFEALARPKGKLIAILVGIIAANLLFAVYHFAHSAPFNQLTMVLFLLIPGLLTSLVYFVGRDIYATILFHNFLGMTGVIQNIDLTFFSQPLYPLYGLVLTSILALIGADLLLIRRVDPQSFLNKQIN